MGFYYFFFLNFMLGILFAWAESDSGEDHLKVIWIFHGGVHKGKYLCFLLQASQFSLKGLLYSLIWCIKNEAWNILIIVWGKIQSFWKMRFLPTSAGMTGNPLAEDQRRGFEDLFHNQMFNRPCKFFWYLEFPNFSRVLRHELSYFLCSCPYIMHSLSPFLDS